MIVVLTAGVVVEVVEVVIATIMPNIFNINVKATFIHVTVIIY